MTCLVWGFARTVAILLASTHSHLHRRRTIDKQRLGPILEARFDCVMCPGQNACTSVCPHLRFLSRLMQDAAHRFHVLQYLSISRPFHCSSIATAASYLRRLL